MPTLLRSTRSHEERLNSSGAIAPFRGSKLVRSRSGAASVRSFPTKRSGRLRKTARDCSCLKLGPRPDRSDGVQVAEVRSQHGGDVFVLYVQAGSRRDPQ